MDHSSLITLSAGALHRGYLAGDFSPVEVVEALSGQIGRVDPLLNALPTRTLEQALETARASERRYRERGAIGPLDGVPFVVKDLLDTAGIRTTYGSSIFASHVPTVDAVAVARARAAGAILLGKSATHEFAWGITTDNPQFGPTRNPWALERVPGGSSGGSAAALASFQAPLALGTDTGGSIRIPAAFCGVVGLKPTRGQVSTQGTFPLAPSFDHVGPMARTPADCALFLQSIASPTPWDPGSSAAEHDDLAWFSGYGLRRIRIGMYPDLHVVALTTAVQTAFTKAVRTVEALGAQVIEVTCDGAQELYHTFATMLLAEARFQHERLGLFPARQADYGQDVRARLRKADAVSLGDYLSARERRDRIQATFAKLFEQVDVLLSPVAAGSPARRGEEWVMHEGQLIEFRELVMSYTVPQNLTGFPAGVVRAGFDEVGLPIGLQFTGRPWRERTVLQAMHAFFEATADLQQRWPALTQHA